MGRESPPSRYRGGTLYRAIMAARVGGCERLHSGMHRVFGHRRPPSAIAASLSFAMHGRRAVTGQSRPFAIMRRLMIEFDPLCQRATSCRRTKCRVDAYARDGADAAEIRSLCPSHANGVSIAKSKSDTISGSVSSRIAATMSGASVVRLTIRLT